MTITHQTTVVFTNVLTTVTSQGGPRDSRRPQQDGKLFKAVVSKTNQEACGHSLERTLTVKLNRLS